MTKDEKSKTESPKYLSRHLVVDRHNNSLEEIRILEYSISGRYFRIGILSTWDTMWCSTKEFENDYDIVEDLPYK